jgi:mannopine transport system permease protein
VIPWRRVPGRKQKGIYGPVLLAVLIAPAALFYFVLFLYPIGALLKEGVWTGQGFTLRHFERIWDEPLYFIILVRTVRISFLVTLCCLILAYPVALWLTRLRGLAFSLAIACILLPLWSSVLVRTYSWAVLLQRNGIVNKTLVRLGITNEPLALLYNEGAVLVAMTHVLLPFMILPIYATMRGIPADLSRAAQSLGASRLREFLFVLLPLSLPGVAAGVVMVFVIALGYFIVPALLGGPRTLMISTLINQQVTSVLNWSFGAALAAMLLATAILIIALFHKLLAASRRAPAGA